MSKSHLNAKNTIKNAFSIIVMYISFIKSFADGTFGTDIVILDPLESQEINILPLLTNFWCLNDRCCSIYRQNDFYIGNQCLYEFGCIILLTMSNIDWIESVHMWWPMNNDISRHLVDQKFSYFSFVALFFYINLHFSRKTNEICTDSFRNNWVINSKINTTSTDSSFSNVWDNIIMSFKWRFYHFYVMELLLCDGALNMSYPSTMESCRWSNDNMKSCR